MRRACATQKGSISTRPVVSMPLSMVAGICMRIGLGSTRSSKGSIFLQRSCRSSKRGATYGWPKCYFNPAQNELVLAPEYGGDGGKKVGVCATLEAPVATFPAHWAPNDMKIYKASAFPQEYRGGAFIAFHGSWNPAGPNGGYNVVFQPLADGRASGKFRVFADGFAGKYKERTRAEHRPSGLAIAPDGALYVSDDKAGRIWRITYSGGSAGNNVKGANR